MRVFDENKIQELFVYDTEQGVLKNDKLFIKSHPAVEEVGHYETHRYPNGGCSKEWVVDTPAVEAYDEYEDIQVYVPYTQAQKDEKRASEIRGRHGAGRPGCRRGSPHSNCLYRLWHQRVFPVHCSHCES